MPASCCWLAFWWSCTSALLTLIFRMLWASRRQIGHLLAAVAVLCIMTWAHSEQMQRWRQGRIAVFLSLVMQITHSLPVSPSSADARPLMPKISWVS